ncbi:MAG TPA: DEAD/DEAH box helicase [Fibrobacteria bacterium]|nr:DEAD/DEAH box helicase [Fibrobacteria bacterium]
MAKFPAMLQNAASVLEELSPDEVLRLAESAYPTKAKDLRSHLERLQWLRSHGEWAAILPHLPTKIIHRIQERTRTVDSNPLHLDHAAAMYLHEILKPYPKILTARAMDYVDEFEELHWVASYQGWMANVWGTRDYRVKVGLDGSDSCTCPYHREQGECKHVAALCLRLLRECAKLGLDANPPPPPQPKSPSGQILPFPTPGSGSRPPQPALPPPTSQPAPRSAPAGGRGPARQIDASLALRRIADLLAYPDTTNRNPRQRVVYILKTEGRHPRSRIADIVPSAEQLGKDGNWRLDGVDLRRTLGNRVRTSPPQYLSPADIALIQECTAPTTYTWPPIPPAPQHLLMEKASRMGLLVDTNGSHLLLDPSYWRPIPRLVEHGDESVFELSLVATDSAAPVFEPGESWIWFGRQGDLSVRDGKRVFRIDPRTPVGLFQIFQDAERIPTSALAASKRELSLLSRRGVEIPPQLLPEVLRESPLRRVRIQEIASNLGVSLVLAYPSLTIPEGSDDSVLEFTSESGDLLQLERDPDAERILADELDRILLDADIVFKTEGRQRAIADFDSVRALALAGLPALAQAGWEVEEARLLDPWRRRKGVFRMSGRPSGQDWFELSGVVDFDGLEVPLSTLVASRGSVKLADGSTGELSIKLLERLDWMTRLGEATPDGIRLRGMHAALALELSECGLGEVRDPEAWKRDLAPFVDRRIVPVPQPAALRASLRPYQKHGLDWLGSLRQQCLGGILADDMGLGKTVQLIAHLCSIFEQDPSAPPALVVGPASVAGNWIAEIARFAPHLRTRLLHGIGRDDLRDAPLDGPTIFVTTYGTLPREIEWLRNLEFSLAIFDESQAIRNAATVAHQTCALVRTRQKVCLTGTPIENSLSDLWAQFSILNPGLLGPKQAFLDQFQPFPGEAPDLSRLRMLTAPFWLRRTKQVVASDLPPREDILLEVELDAKQMNLYQRQLKDYQKHLLPELRRKGLNEGGRFQVLTALLRLRQIACAPELAGHKGPAAKLDVLVDKLVEDIAEGHRALVFSSFTSLLDLVGNRLRKERVEFLRLDGSTPARERTRLIHRFQNGLDESVFLVSLKAGGAGVNLTGADYVFLLDPWWNPAVEEQAAARTHRIGQTNPVTIYRLVAKDTIEERVLALARGKAQLASALFDAGETGGKALTMEVVQELLG